MKAGAQAMSCMCEAISLMSNAAGWSSLPGWPHDPRWFPGTSRVETQLPASSHYFMSLFLWLGLFGGKLGSKCLPLVTLGPLWLKKVLTPVPSSSPFTFCCIFTVLCTKVPFQSEDHSPLFELV